MMKQVRAENKLAI